MLTVGVAPGTTTLQLGEVYPGVAAKSINWMPKRPCPPEEERWFMPDRADDVFHQVAHPTGFKGLGKQRVVFYDPYANDIWRLRGLRGLREISPPRIRWDLIGIVGGGAFAVALVTSLIASGLK